MRVIAGKYRGRRIAPPEGRQTRPTTDRVRESLMSTLTSMLRGSMEGVCVLDAFAGSGAFGIECLSRGAAWVCLCDNSRRALATIKGNCGFVPATDVSIQRVDMTKALPNLADHTIDLAFFDPPYAMDAREVAQIVLRLDQARALSRACIVAYEHASKDSDLALQAFSSVACDFVKRKDFHSTSISFFRMRAERDAHADDGVLIDADRRLEGDIRQSDPADSFSSGKELS